MRRSIRAPLVVGAIIAATSTAAAAVHPGAANESAVAQAVRSVAIVNTAHGTGAGVAVGDSRVVTAAHLVSGQTTVLLRTADGREVPATVVRDDPQRDIAVLAAPDLDLPAARLWNERPDIGDPVYAAGAPMGDYLQLTAGIVSALPDKGGVVSIQTDAPINPGNSGGPLLDVEGRVIGIVVTKRSTSEGIGWATATSEVEAVMERALSGASGSGAARSSGPSEPSRVTPDNAAWPAWLLPVGLLGVVLIGIAVTVLSAERTRRTRRPAVVVLEPLDLTDDPELNTWKAPHGHSEPERH